MQKILIFITVCIFSASLTACGGASQSVETIDVANKDTESTATSSSVESTENEYTNSEKDYKRDITKMKMNVKIGNATFTATLEDNDATRELVKMMKQQPISINMSDYSGFEKVGSLGKSLTTNDKQTTTTAGDIVLYMGNQIVMFYGSNSWSYTRIGKIDDLSGWEDALGAGNISVVFSLAK